MFGKLSFSNKLLLGVLSIVFLSSLLSTFFVSSKSFESTENISKLYINELATKYTSNLKGSMDKAVTAVYGISSFYNSMVKKEITYSKKSIENYLRDTLKKNPDILGVWANIRGKYFPFEYVPSLAKKEGHDADGRYMPYIVRSNGKIIQSFNSVEEVAFTKDFITGSQKSGKEYITDVYLYPIDGVDTLLVSITVPMYHKGEFIGVAGADIAMTDLSNMVSSIKVKDNGYAFLVTNKGTIAAHPMKELIGKNILKVDNSKVIEDLVTHVKENKKFSFYRESLKDGLESYFDMVPFEIANSGISAGLVISVPKEEYLEDAIALRWYSIVAGIISVILVGLVVFLLLRKLNINLSLISRGLNDFFAYLNKKSTSAKQIEINSNDEFGTMAKSINENVQAISVAINKDNALIENVKDIASDVNRGFMDKRITNSTNTDSLNELKNILNDMLNTLENFVGKDINKINEVLSKYTQRDFTAKLDNSNSGQIGNEIIEMNDMITQMLVNNQNRGFLIRDTSTELTSNMSTLSNNATSQAASLEETAASIDEITANIEKTSQKAQEMLSISNDTKSSASEGKKLATDTVNAMNEINETVININEAISVIDQIAFQTNILSLNAAVEAATAGEAGKGFAVVAAEVRNLASRSAEAAKEIKELVENATTRANNGKNISSKMIEGFTTLEDKIVDTSKLIDDVTNAAKEQSIGMNQIADAVGQLDKFTQENTVVADKTNEIANNTRSVAENVVEDISKNNFDGKSSEAPRKNTTVREATIQTPKVQTSIVSKKPRKKVVSNIEESKVIQPQPSNDDEWESF